MSGYIEKYVEYRCRAEMWAAKGDMARARMCQHIADQTAAQIEERDAS